MDILSEATDTVIPAIRMVPSTMDLTIIAIAIQGIQGVTHIIIHPLIPTGTTVITATGILAAITVPPAQAAMDPLVRAVSAAEVIEAAEAVDPAEVVADNNFKIESI